jgi:hypothetical protein
LWWCWSAGADRWLHSATVVRGAADRVAQTGVGGEQLLQPTVRLGIDLSVGISVGIRVGIGAGISVGLGVGRGVALGRSAGVGVKAADQAAEGAVELLVRGVLADAENPVRIRSHHCHHLMCYSSIDRGDAAARRTDDVLRRTSGRCRRVEGFTGGRPHHRVRY